MLTQERLRARLDYDPETGIFRWRAGVKGRLAGSIAGRRHRRGYWEIGVDGRLRRAHRLAWLYVYGRWPEPTADHRNGKTDDNRIANLREATRCQNNANMRLNRRNRSGFKGVSYNRQQDCWMAFITAEGRTRYLGKFSTPEAAAAAYAAAAPKYHGEFARLA